MTVAPVVPAAVAAVKPVAPVVVKAPVTVAPVKATITLAEVPELAEPTKLSNEVMEIVEPMTEIPEEIKDDNDAKLDAVPVETNEVVPTVVETVVKPVEVVTVAPVVKPVKKVTTEAPGKLLTGIYIQLILFELKTFFLQVSLMTL